MNNRFVDLKKTLGRYILNLSVEKVGDKEIVFDSTEIFEGLEINTYDEKGDVIPLEDGEYTISGQKVKVSNGKISEFMDKEPSKEPIEKPKEDVSEVKPDENNASEVSALKAEIEEKDAEIAALKAELDELKKPADKPVPQQTNMSTNVESSNLCKGTKFEKAFRVFNNK